MPQLRAIHAVRRHPLQIVSDTVSDRGSVGLGVAVPARGRVLIRDGAVFAGGAVAIASVESAFNDVGEELLQVNVLPQEVPSGSEGLICVGAS